MKSALKWLMWFASIVGGFILANCILCVVVLVTRSDFAGKLIIPIIFLPVIWSFAGIWLFNSKTIRQVLLKSFYSISFSGSIALILFLAGV